MNEQAQFAEKYPELCLNETQFSWLDSLGFKHHAIATAERNEKAQRRRFWL